MVKGAERAEQLLDAGLAALTARPAAEILPSRAEVLRATEEDGRDLGPASTGSFRHAFGSLDEFHRRLVEERLVRANPADPETAATLRAGVAAIVDGVGDLPPLIGRIARRDLEAHVGRPDMARARILTLAAALAPGGEGVAEALRTELSRVNTDLADACRLLLDVWGMQLRAPFTPESVTGMVAALATGMTIRHLVDPVSVDLDAYQDIVVALVTLLVARPGDDRSTDQLVAEVLPLVLARAEE